MSDNALDRLTSLTDELSSLRAKAATEGKTLLKDAAKTIFSNHPSLQYITWNQGVPSWRDGDPCTFEIHDIWGRVGDWPKNKDGDEIWPSELGGYNGEEFHNVDGCKDLALIDAFEAFCKAVVNLGDLLAEILEQDCTVFITKGGIETEYYEMN